MSTNESRDQQPRDSPYHTPCSLTLLSQGAGLHALPACTEAHTHTEKANVSHDQYLCKSEGIPAPKRLIQGSKTIRLLSALMLLLIGGAHWALGGRSSDRGASANGNPWQGRACWPSFLNSDKSSALTLRLTCPFYSCWTQPHYTVSQRGTSVVALTKPAWLAGLISCSLLHTEPSLGEESCFPFKSTVQYRESISRGFSSQFFCWL